jgi:hypothetical protein
MKFRRTLIGLALVATALGFTTGAMAQAAYKPEYKMSSRVTRRASSARCARA